MRNFIQDGDELDLLNGSGAAVSSGAVVVEGLLSGIACNDMAIAERGPCKMEGVFGLPVTDTVGGGIAIGAQLRIVLATGAIVNTAYSAGAVIHFGYALEVIAAGETETINVLKSKPGNPIE